jgi:hypothetical protein
MKSDMVQSLENSTHNSNPNQSCHLSSNGRQGDPRMHQAVAVRIENPDLTLFQALQAGGFDYPTEDCSAFVDSENVTLGQRKNQLSRRIRLFKKHSGGDPNVGDSIAVPSGSGSDDCSVGHSQHSHTSPTNGPSTSTHNSKPPMEHGNHKNSLPTMDHAMLPLSGRKRGLSESTNDFTITAADSQESGSVDPTHLLATIAPRNPTTTITNDFGPPPPHLRTTSWDGGEDFGEAFGMPFQHFRQQQLRRQQQQQQQPSSHNRHQQQLQQQEMQQQPQHVHMPTRLASTPPAPSGVAVASLNQTAANAGLTLDQLALTLSGSSNLAEVLLQTTDSSDCEKQHELALQLYQNEARTLYQKSMLMAGYRHEDCCEGSSNHSQFALAAWQFEGEHLHELMGEHISEAPLEVNVKAAAVSISTDIPPLKSLSQGQTRSRPSGTSVAGALYNDHGPHEHEHGHSHEQLLSLRASVTTEHLTFS